jgi:large subunit ribosomal protein L23
VPLRWTKFDLRDYLWNLYDVEVKKVRSYVKEMPLARRPGAAQGWYRPQSKKIMTVELAKPFQWPEMPTDLEPWNKELFDRREEKMDEQRKLQKERHDMTLPMKSRQPLTETRKELAKLAQKMVAGEVEWRNDVTLDPKWDKILEEASGKNGLKGSKKSEPKEGQEELTR